jgi:hypothetical protein
MAFSWWDNPLAQELSLIQDIDRNTRFFSASTDRALPPRPPLTALNIILSSRDKELVQSWQEYAQSHSSEVQVLLDRFEEGDITVVNEVAKMLRSEQAHVGNYSDGGPVLGEGQRDARLNQLRAQQLLATQAYLRKNKPISPEESRDPILGERPIEVGPLRNLFDAAFRAVVAVSERENALTGYTSVIQRTPEVEVRPVPELP